MVKLDSASRFSLIKESLFLAQTDTTVGFLSQNRRRLQRVKSRPNSKPFIKVYNSLQAYKEDKGRIPNTQKSRLRRSKKTTFIVKNIAFRIAPTQQHSSLLRALPWFYSTSANESGKSYQRAFCVEKADIIIEDRDSLYEGNASKLLKINSKSIKRLR